MKSVDSSLLTWRASGVVIIDGPVTEPLLYQWEPVGRPPVAIPVVRMFMMPREVEVDKGGGAQGR